jgi:hypothetical protein
MFSLSFWPVAGSFLLQLSPYLVVALILAAAAGLSFASSPVDAAAAACSDGTSAQPVKQTFLSAAAAIAAAVRPTAVPATPKPERNRHC